MHHRGYYLTEIRDEAVPLASGNSSPFYVVTVIIMIIAILLLVLCIYLLACRKYRKRMVSLEAPKEIYHGWNLRRLRETVEELELKKAENLNLFVDNERLNS